jgi:hypothetical protein
MKEISPIVTQVHIKEFQSEIIGSKRIVASERHAHQRDPNTRTGCSKSKVLPVLTTKKQLEAIAKTSVDGRNQ